MITEGGPVGKLLHDPDIALRGEWAHWDRVPRRAITATRSSRSSTNNSTKAWPARPGSCTMYVPVPGRLPFRLGVTR